MNLRLAPGAACGELARGPGWGGEASAGWCRWVGTAGASVCGHCSHRAADVASRMAGLFFLLCLQTFPPLLQWRVTSFLRCDFFFPRLQPKSPFDVLSLVVRPDVWPERMYRHSRCVLCEVLFFPFFYRQGSNGTRWKVTVSVLSVALGHGNRFHACPVAREIAVEFGDPGSQTKLRPDPRQFSQ